MISYTEFRNNFGTLSVNTKTENLDMGSKLANIEQRYLLQKYFANETRFAITTVGSQTLAATATILAGATSATLTAPWGYHTTTAYVSFDNGDTFITQFTRNSTAISWPVGLSANAGTTLSVGGLQFYPAPPNYSKMKTVTITIGNLTWTPGEVLTREEWDKLNVFPYYADIPDRFFMYPAGDHGVQLGIWPIPSTTGNVLTCNYKFRVPDLSMADYTTPGTVSITQGSTTVTGVGTSFVPTTNPQLESRWIKFAQPTGDELWYQIDRVISTTQISLFVPYQGITIAASSAYTIGQMPIIAEDFQDMLLWKALGYYFTSIVDNKGKREMYQAYYKEKLALLDEYSGSTTVHVNLGRRANNMNPNLFPQSIG